MKRLSFSLPVIMMFCLPKLSGKSPGFSLNDRQHKSISGGDSINGTQLSGILTAISSVKQLNVITKTSNYLFVNNTNTTIGQLEEHSGLLNYLTALSPGIISFPGGNIFIALIITPTGSINKMTTK